MPKAKLTDLKRFLAELSEAELREEVQKLFAKLPQVQAFYAQELLSPADRKKVVDELKKKIAGQFFTRMGNPRSSSNAELRKLISDFEKTAVVKADVVELLIYRVEQAVKFDDAYGGMPDGDYNAAVNAFEKALKLIQLERLETWFETRCREITSVGDNYDGWFKDQLDDLTDEYLR